MLAKGTYKNKSEFFNYLVIDAYLAERLSGLNHLSGIKLNRAVAINPIEQACSVLFAEKAMAECISIGKRNLDFKWLQSYLL